MTSRKVTDRFLPVGSRAWIWRGDDRPRLPGVILDRDWHFYLVKTLGGKVRWVARSGLECR